MKKCVLILLITICSHSYRANAQAEEAQQLLLDVEKLVQLKQLLADFKEGYQILFTGYSTVQNLSEGNFNLHKEFLDKLLDISPVVKNYRKIPEIVSFQLSLVNEYKRAFKQCKESDLFTPNEMVYLSRVYSNLFDESLKNLDVLASVITANKLRMSDDERLSMIDTIHQDMREKLTFLRYFNNKNKVLALQRSKESADINTTRKLHGMAD